jgi:DNA-binding NarL/FixJ family response regulator
MKTKIVFLTIHEDPAMVSLAREVGGNGYVVKNHIATDLIPAIEEAAKTDCQFQMRK